MQTSCVRNACFPPSRRIRLGRCSALPLSLETALSQRTNKALLRSICEDAFQLQEERCQRQNERLENMLKERTGQLLFTRGLLNVRGVLEYLEDECRVSHIFEKDPSRQEIWAQILQESGKESLVACLLRANDKLKRKSTKPHSLEQDISEMYQHAGNSIHGHGKLSPVQYEGMRRSVEIVEGPLLPNHCQMFVCICQHFGVPYRYSQVNAQVEIDQTA